MRLPPFPGLAALTGALLLATATAAPTRAQLGAPPPELDAVRWFNTPPLSFEDLRGKAVLVEMFRTWDPRSETNVASLDSRHAKSAKKGLVVLAVTYEEVEVVDEWVQRVKPSYPVAVLSSQELEGFLGVAGYPTDAVLDPNGSVTYVGFSPESAISAALDTAEKGPYWTKKLTRVAELIGARDPVKGWAELQKILKKGGLDEDEAAKAERLRAYLEETAANALAQARTFAEEGLVHRAVTALRPFAEAKVAFPSSAESAAFLAALEAAPGFKDEMKAGEDFAEARSLELQRQYTKAFEGYVEILDRHPATRVAALARARAEQLIEDEKTGFRWDCQTCQDADKACAGHFEERGLD